MVSRCKVSILLKCQMSRQTCISGRLVASRTTSTVGRCHVHWDDMLMKGKGVRPTREGWMKYPDHEPAPPPELYSNTPKQGYCVPQVHSYIAPPPKIYFLDVASNAYQHPISSTSVAHKKPTHFLNLDPSKFPPLYIQSRAQEKLTWTRSFSSPCSCQASCQKRPPGPVVCGKLGKRPLTFPNLSHKGKIWYPAGHVGIEAVKMYLQVWVLLQCMLYSNGMGICYTALMRLN